MASIKLTINMDAKQINLLKLFCPGKIKQRQPIYTPHIAPPSASYIIDKLENYTQYRFSNGNVRNAF